jgi:hypothetical protein
MMRCSAGMPVAAWQPSAQRQPWSLDRAALGGNHVLPASLLAGAAGAPAHPAKPPKGLCSDGVPGQWGAMAGVDDARVGLAHPTTPPTPATCCALLQWSDDKCLQILASLRKTMPPGATLVNFDVVLPDEGAAQAQHPGLSYDMVMMVGAALPCYSWLVCYAVLC